MKDRYFIDTNIFVYSFDINELQKRKRAIDLIQNGLASGNGIISFQVVQEFINISTRKFESPFSINEIKDYYKQFLKPLINIYPTEELYDQALDVMDNTNYNFYDSLIIGSAIMSEVSILYSEDLQHNHKIRRLKIINPFI